MTESMKMAEAEADAFAVGGMLETSIGSGPTTEKSSAVGNAAAMREALENSNGLLEELAAIGEWGESAREQIAENNAALAEPARNCDLYDNKTDAETRFAEETGEDDRAQHYWQMFALWLFYHAAERKGEEA